MNAYSPFSFHRSFIETVCKSNRVNIQKKNPLYQVTAAIGSSCNTRKLRMACFQLGISVIACFRAAQPKTFVPTQLFFFYLSSACAFFASGFRYAATRRAIPLSFRVNVATSIATARDLYITQFLCMCMRCVFSYIFGFICFSSCEHCTLSSVFTKLFAYYAGVYFVCVGRKRLSYRRARLFRIESEMVYTSL